MRLSSERANETNEESDAPASEPSRPIGLPKLAPIRESLSTLEEDDFDLHDTIPAPPWIEDAPDSSEQPLQPTR
ncbi:MAG TPA: hypothetical protein VGI10_29605 [Polyangiaceae bacterium]|jgi:hypothetical protein